MRPRFAVVPRHWIFMMAGLFVSLPLQAQTEAKGRAVFRQAGCTVCHPFVSRIGAPSAKEMKSRFLDNAEAVQKGMKSAPTHATDPSLKAVTPEQQKQLTEWLSGAWYRGGQGAIAMASSPEVDPKIAEAEAKKAARAKRIAEAKAKREAEALARLEKMEQARKEAVARAKLKREEDEKAKLAAAERASKAREEQAALKREAEEKAKRAALARAQSDAEKQAAQKREADELARKVAAAKAANDQAAEARLKREAEEKARQAEAEKARQEAEARLAAQRYEEELARREAELKARREAEEQLALRREAEERARREAEIAQREAEARAKREAEAKAKREADALAAAAAAKAPVVVAKAGRGKLKAPDKFRDEPCEPYTGPPVTQVDEDAAKAIMDRIDCGGCHAYVQKKTGPPLKKVFEKVKGNPACVVYKLKNNKEHNDEGVTGELKGPEFQILGNYLATRAR